MQINTTVDSATHLLEQLNLKTSDSSNASEGCGDTEPHTLVVGKIKWYSHFGKQLGSFFKN